MFRKAGDAYGLEIVLMPLCIECMCFNERKAKDKWGTHCKLSTMKGVCFYTVKVNKNQTQNFKPCLVIFTC